MCSEVMDIDWTVGCRFADGFDIDDGESPFCYNFQRLPAPWSLVTLSPRPRLASKKKQQRHQVLHLEDPRTPIQCFGDKIYDPYVDYLRLSNFDQEYTGGRGELCSPTSDGTSQSSDGPNGEHLGLQILICARAAEKRLNSEFYRLDEERLHSFEEFVYNGVACDLDEYDKIQQKIRGQEPPTREIPVVPNDSLKEYLWHKHCKTATASNTTPVNFGKKKNKLICVFCKNNKEPQNVYTGHVLKDSRGYTMCPVLRKYPCPICQAIGDHAHTIKYCPFNNDSEFRTSPSPLRTNRMATGKLRR